MPRVLSRAVLCAALLSLTAFAWGQRYPRIRVDFQHPVVVGSETLAPGAYVFQHLKMSGNPPVFRVTNSQGKNITLTAVAIRTTLPASSSASNPDYAKSTQVVLQKIGGTYYLDKIWVQGRSRGWDFEIPASAKSQASSMQQEVVPGTYDEGNNEAEDNTTETQSSASNSNQNSMNNAQGANSEEYGENSTATAGQNQQASTSGMATQSTANENSMNNAQGANAEQYGESSTATAGQNQQASTSGMATQSTANAGMATGEQLSSVTGCLERGSSSNSYYIQTSAGKQVNVRPGENLQTDLSQQVGRQVRLVGEQTDNNSTNNMTSTGAMNNSGSAMTNSGAFLVNRIDVIATSCGQ